MKDVSILIPHYNQPHLIAPCLESLQALASGTPSHEIVVIDDGSTDESAEWIRKEHPEVRLVRSETNRGFVRAINLGVESSQGEILVFLNNDTWVEPDSIRELVVPLLEGKVEGATGSVLMDWEGRTGTFLGATMNVCGYGFEERGELPPPDRPPYPQIMVCGGGMAIPRDIYRKVGGFDESFGMIYEDLDLGWRLNRLGYDCFMIPSSRVGHRTHASLGRQTFEAKGRYYLGNPIRTVFKNWDEEDHLEHLGMVITLAEARERVCLLGGEAEGGLFSRWFGNRETTPLVGALVKEEEKTRDLKAKRDFIRKNAKRSTRDLLHRFVPDPVRRWAFDPEQEALLARQGYWDLERHLFHKRGWIG